MPRVPCYHHGLLSPPVARQRGEGRGHAVGTAFAGADSLGLGGRPPSGAVFWSGEEAHVVRTPGPAAHTPRLEYLPSFSSAAPQGAGYSQSAIKPELFSSKVPLPSQHVGVVGGDRRGLLRGEGDPPGIGDLAFLQVLHQLCKPALRGGVIF